MSSRAASAASSRRVKQELVRLLFGKSNKESTIIQATTTANKKPLDHTSFSYSDLRTAYLQRLQTLHPDKDYSKRETDPHHHSRRHHEFVQLQQAWDRYDQMAKVVANNIDADSSFTLFGVGCSFADNEREREWRNEITDQACRGWFSSGSLAEEATSDGDDKNKYMKGTSQHISLLNDEDDMFIAVPEETDKDHKQQPKEDNIRPRRSLVDTKFRPRSAGG
ncbi:expressed unknown protein [Seminavis robusta]|uniref:J domain-containing protein n=1 Tax=Seminavis robusta TaxID=568900 RepID=A0A9N8EXR7_9STRA|nr:expressed unknown protein [Seminavis robusta]|eukprot:Sro2017_g311190.1 n/a (222) ;mRNA; f:5537-6202